MRFAARTSGIAAVLTVFVATLIVGMKAGSSATLTSGGLGFIGTWPAAAGAVLGLLTLFSSVPGRTTYSEADHAEHQ